MNTHAGSFEPVRARDDELGLGNVCWRPAPKGAHVAWAVPVAHANDIHGGNFGFGQRDGGLELLHRLVQGFVARFRGVETLLDVGEVFIGGLPSFRELCNSSDSLLDELCSGVGGDLFVSSFK